MTFDKEDVHAAIKRKVIELADLMGSDASDLQADEIIPATGLIDSAGLLELVAWFEQTYDLAIPAAELTIDNLGSINAMADYLFQRKGLV